MRVLCVGLEEVHPRQVLVEDLPLAAEEVLGDLLKTVWEDSPKNVFTRGRPRGSRALLAGVADTRLRCALQARMRWVRPLLRPHRQTRARAFDQSPSVIGQFSVGSTKFGVVPVKLWSGSAKSGGIVPSLKVGSAESRGGFSLSSSI